MEIQRSLDSLLSEWRNAADLSGPEVSAMHEHIFSAPRREIVLSVDWWQRVLSVPPTPTAPVPFLARSIGRLVASDMNL